ncbi:hypothetical protein GCM10009122_50880 [Fulvivirga kasyanovii]|uniref:Uncharacterized protein n=1 Tax=Fulvivirga kasyanovii TaxID=396812 RepID=A0ABW9RXV4_9BACT|nr:hypothetical protein [Fulvivirga kasyanovii]MTI28023.1 hypothetical protein [Fulvivirga kasyanovii]
MELRMQLKSDFFNQASWEQLYIITDHWKSDLCFYHDETKFLKHLVDRYSIWLTLPDNIEQVRQVSEKLQVCERFKNDLLDTIARHMKHIKDMIENPFVHNEQAFREEHAQLEEDVADYVKSHRNLKKEIFAITEEVVESEKLQHLLGQNNNS